MFNNQLNFQKYIYLYKINKILYIIQKVKDLKNIYNNSKKKMNIKIYF